MKTFFDATIALLTLAWALVSLVLAAPAPTETRDTQTKAPQEALDINITPAQIQQLGQMGYSPAQVIAAVFKYLQKQISNYNPSSPSGSRMGHVEVGNGRRRGQHAKDKGDRQKKAEEQSGGKGRSKNKGRKGQKLFQSQGSKSTCLSHHKQTGDEGSAKGNETGKQGQGDKNANSTSTSSASSCFPALGFQMPDDVPVDTDGWWCDPNTEYAFLGFSYEVSACQSADQLKKEFQDARDRFQSRYIRLYGACDRDGFYDDVIEAAWSASVGVQALIWFGFDGDDKWKSRRDDLFDTLYSNPKAPFVTRGVQFGSEPLYDQVLPPSQLASQVSDAQTTLRPLGINVTVSDLAYGFQSTADQGSQKVLDQIDFIDAHMLPYFSQHASTGDKAWPDVQNDLNYFLDNGKGKKIYFSENGWPSTHYCPGVCPNSPDAVSSVDSEHKYYKLLDSKCEYLKQVNGGGVGWFAHIYSDNQEPGYGIYDTNMKLKFDFSPKTSC